jgi:hypothetical protein
MAENMKTIIHGDTSIRKQPRLNEEIVDYIDSITKTNNKKYTRGVVIYEILMMYDYIDGYTDNIDELESIYDRRLEREYTGIVSDINSVEIDYTKLNTDMDKQYNIWIPEIVSENMSDRYSESIIDAINEYKEQPYRDRSHRKTVKKEILEYINSDDSDVDILEYDDVTYSILMNEYQNTDSIEEKIEDVELEWYEKRDTSFADIKEVAEERTKETKKARIKVLKAYYNKQIEYIKNYDEWDEEDIDDILQSWLPNTKKDIKEDINELFTVSTPTRNSYADELYEYLFDT